MFARVSFSEKTCSGSMSKSGLSCYNGPVSTLCCAKRKDSGRNMGRAKKSEVPFFSPAHLSAFLTPPSPRDAISSGQSQLICGLEFRESLVCVRGRPHSCRGRVKMHPFPSFGLARPGLSRQHGKKGAIASIFDHWASMVYSGVQGSPRQSHHIFSARPALVVLARVIRPMPSSRRTVARYSRLATGAMPGPIAIRPGVCSARK
jgi:hypothetical protein